MAAWILVGLALVQLNGVIEGTVQDESGRLRAGIRVGAVSPSDQDVLVSNTRTDQEGRYRLEVPQGRYHIVAGRLECPAYYRGTPDAETATAVEVFGTPQKHGHRFYGRFYPGPCTPRKGRRPFSVWIVWASVGLNLRVPPVP